MPGRMYHAWLFPFIIIESKCAVNCHHFIYFHKCNKNKFMYGKYHCFSKKIIRRCLINDATMLPKNVGSNDILSCNNVIGVKL